VQTITVDLVTIALERAEGTPFENFVSAFYPAISGSTYVPLGGLHDGGADGFFDTGVSEVRGKQGAFLQASISEDHRAKIRGTVKRLREFGRTPTSLTYVTSRVIQYVDTEEELLSEELSVNLRIRDRKYIATQITTSHVTTDAFNQYLRPYLASLSTAGNIPLIEPSQNVKSPAVYVFLRQEVERRLGKSSLIEAVSDGLILWALEGTDPDKSIFMTGDQVLAKIEEAVPPARQFLRGIYRDRLGLLASKQNPSGREVRWYKKDDLFCLPFETRQIVETENIEDEALRVRVLETLGARASSLVKDLTPQDAAAIAGIAVRALQLTFETEGLEFAAFLHGTDQAEEDYSIGDGIDKALVQSNVAGEKQVAWKEVLVRMLRTTIYESTEEERLYLGKLSRTYLLLFSLNAEPRIIEYFQTMASDFYLYVGSDILIHALSERYLRKEDQMTTNLLAMLAQAGATLVLSEPVIEEVHKNLETSDWEFTNYFSWNEAHVTLEVARHAPKILIRAYFYAKLDPPTGIKAPTNWNSYINQFCTYDDLHSATGLQELKGYLLNKFQMKYEPRAELHKLCDEDQLAELTERILPGKKKEILAKNDALMILATYGRRTALNEHSQTTAFGFRTWWLTHEVRVRMHTDDLYKEHGSHYIMRPEFLLNFIALSPSVVEVRKAYENVFPTLLNVKLSGRMHEETFHGLLGKTKEAAEFEEPRLRVAMASLSNRLKGDFYKQYETDLRSGTVTFNP
jgi:hypothetical protein